MNEKQKIKNQYSERLRKSLATAAPMMIKPALGAAVFDLVENHQDISRVTLVKYFRQKLQTCPSITGDVEKELDLSRLSFEHTLVFLGEEIE